MNTDRANMILQLAVKRNVILNEDEYLKICLMKNKEVLPLKVNLVNAMLLNFINKLKNNPG